MKTNYLPTAEGDAILVTAHAKHQYVLSSAQVALGYGISLNALREHQKKHADELIEGKHWIRTEDDSTATGLLLWTKRGVIRLGFFIHSKSAKRFRAAAEDLVIQSAEPQLAPRQNSFTHPEGYVLIPHEAIAQMTQAMLEQNREILGMLSQLADRLSLPGKSSTPPKFPGGCSVSEYFLKRGIRLSRSQAATYGQNAKAYAQKHQLLWGRKRYEGNTVNAFQTEDLDKVFGEIFKA